MRFPKPWYRRSRGAWFVTLDGQQIKLGEGKRQAFAYYKELLAKPQKRTVRTDSLLAIIDVFLEWCHEHRAPDTYEWYRYRLERFARRYPDLWTDRLRPYHVQEWLDDMDLSSGSKRNYCRAIKRCMRWAKKQGYVEENAIADDYADRKLEVCTSEPLDVLTPLLTNDDRQRLRSAGFKSGLMFGRFGLGRNDKIRLEPSHFFVRAKKTTLTK